MEARVTRVRAAFLAALVLLGNRAAAADLTPKEALLFEQLRTRIAGVEKGLDGILGVCVKDPKSGASIEIRANEVFPTASSIKVAVLYELYRQAEESRIDLDEVTRPGLPRVGGGGVLELLGPAVSLTWRDLAVMMFGWSDNEATNVLVRRLGQDAINQRLAALGLKETRLRRLMMDLEAARRGNENVSTPGELLRLMETLRAGSGLSPARAADMMAIATVPKESPFRLPLPAGLKVADKPGSLDAVRCVTAVVELPGRPYAASIMTTYLHRDQDGEAAIREISAALYETFDRLARSSEYGRIIN
jgi:beta-lactamase class A